MYSFGDLFDRRSTVGANIERILDDRKITKVELCKNTGVSRPTIDKLLAGTLTSKTNYEEHKLFGKGILLNHSFSTKQRGSIANRFHRMLSGICPDCGCSRVFSFSHYTTPTKR